MGKNQSFKLILEGLDCANCANKIENRINKLERIKEANVNFSTSQLYVEVEGEIDKNQLIAEIQTLVTQLEPGVRVVEKATAPIKVKKSSCCSGESCEIEHEHTHSYKHGHDHNHVDSTYMNHPITSFIRENMWLIVGVTNV